MLECESAIDSYGQFFTPSKIVKQMLALRNNKGTVLEPSCGDGAFLSKLEETAVGIEIDARVMRRDARVINDCFFNYPTKNKFDTVIGNPPYVMRKNIPPATRSKIDRDYPRVTGNLYLCFIAKSIEHLNDGGELIFITPRNFLHATTARTLNRVLYATGSMTHYYELGDAKIFKNASPNCAIFRWQKGLTHRRMVTGQTFSCTDGQILFDSSSRKVKDFFDVKVGAVSGADDIFANQEHGDTDFVCSRTRTRKETRHMIYDKYHPCLEKHKQRLLSRKVINFTESNWWRWGRKFTQREGSRIYVNAMSRHDNPFFVSSIKAYDGSILALFPKMKIDLYRATRILNEADWEKLGFVCDGRLLLGQRSLANAPLNLENAVIKESAGATGND